MPTVRFDTSMLDPKSFVRNLKRKKEQLLQQKKRLKICTKFFQQN